MKNIFILFLILFTSTYCFASTDVYLRDSDGNIVDPGVLKDTSGNAVSVTSNSLHTNTRLWDGSNYVDIQDQRLKTWTAPNVIGAFTTYNHTNVSSSTILQVGTGYAYDITLKAGAANKDTIYLGPSTMATTNVLTVGFPIATSQTVHFDIVNLSQLYVLSGATGTDKNSISYASNVE